MRRNPLALFMILTMAIGGLAVSATPAGAAPIGRHVLHAHAGTPATGARGHITSPVPPLTRSYLELVDSGGNADYAPATGQTPTDPSTTGSSLDLVLTATIPGIGLATVHVTASTGNNTQPLQVGTIYGSGHTGSVNLLLGSSTCMSGQFGDAAQLIVDQLTEVGGVVTSAAVQVACASLGFAVPFLFGSVAYNAVPTTPHQGYYSYESDGILTGFGNDSYLNYLGDLSFVQLNQPIVGMAQTADGGGYWMVGSDGGIFAFGDAAFYGSTGNLTLNKPIVGMAATKDGKGYWLVASDGGIFAYGDAAFYGSTGNLTLNKPIVGMAPTADGNGYWLVAADGGIFAYGDAAFYGSTGNITLNRPVVGMTPTPDGRGYWFVASDGGIFAYGDAAFSGSTGNLTLNQPIVGMATTGTGTGYWLVAADGGIFGFNVPYYGSLPGAGLSVNDVVGLSTLPGIGA